MRTQRRSAESVFVCVLRLFEAHWRDRGRERKNGKKTESFTALSNTLFLHCDTHFLSLPLSLSLFFHRPSFSKPAVLSADRMRHTHTLGRTPPSLPASRPCCHHLCTAVLSAAPAPAKDAGAVRKTETVQNGTRRRTAQRVTKARNNILLYPPLCRVWSLDTCMHEPPPLAHRHLPSAALRCPSTLLPQPRVALRRSPAPARPRFPHPRFPVLPRVSPSTTLVWTRPSSAT